GLLPPLMIKTLIDHALPSGDLSQLNVLAIGIVVVPLAAGLVGVGQNYLNLRIGQAIMFDLRNDLYLNIQRQSLKFYTNARTGELMSRVSGDVSEIQGV